MDDGAGGVAVVGGEAAGEVGGAFVAEFVGDGFDLDAGLAEEDEGLGHFQAEETVVGGLIGEAFEEAGEVAGGDVAGGGGFFDAGEAGIVAEEVVAAAGEGGVGGVGFGLGGLQEGAEAEGVLGGFGGGEVGERGAGEGVVDDLLEEGGDAGGVVDAPEGAGFELELGDEATGGGAVEVEEEFDEGSGGVAFDVMGDGGVEEEDAADGDAVAGVFEDDGASAAPDEFEGEEGEFLAVDDEVRGAPFAAAADEGEGVGGVTLLPVGVEEAPGAGDLAGEVVGVGVGGHVGLRIADFGLGI